LRFCWSTISPEEDQIIQGYDSRLCLFSYYQIYPTSINKTNGASSSKDGVTADIQNHSYSQKSQIASSFLFKTKTLRKKQSRTPSNGFISSFLVLLTTIETLTILTGAKFHHILSFNQQALSLPVSEGVAMSISLLPRESETLFHYLPWKILSRTFSSLSVHFKDSLLPLQMANQRNSTLKFTLIPTQSSSFVTIQQLDIFVMTFKNLFLVHFVKQANP
jgi:hypothetical protein